MAYYEMQRFAALSAANRPELSVKWDDRFLCLGDRTNTTRFDHHYVYHTAWAIRQLAALRPERHIDISSSLFFVGMASVVAPITHLDYRPANLILDRVRCERGDLTRLPFADGEVTSLSCMHVVEHIGLGRYGDPLDPRGDINAAAELARVLSVGGSLLFVAPVGRPRVCFNAHRVYSFEMVLELFSGLDLAEWALVEDSATSGLIANPSPEIVNRQSYGCGCFRFVKNDTRQTRP
jgi:SAM-dependent methyltransferase